VRLIIDHLYSFGVRPSVNSRKALLFLIGWPVVSLLLMITPFASVYPSGAGKADSLMAVIGTLPEDSSKVNAIIELANSFIMTTPDETVKYGEQARGLADAVNYQKGLGYAYKAIGMGYYFQGDYVNTLFNWQQSMETFRAIDDKLGMANMLNNLGAVYFNQGDDQAAIEFYLPSLKASEELGDTLRIATALVNIGAVYFNKKASHDMALDYYSRALPLVKALKDYEAIGTVSVNMGEIYLVRNDLNTALSYFEDALQAYTTSGSVKVAYTLNNIGKAYAQQADLEKAAEVQREAFEKAKGLDAKLEMAQSKIGLANTYELQGNTAEAIDAYNKAKEYAQEISAGYELEDAYLGLAENYAKLSDYNNAYRYKDLLIDIKDSLYNSEMDKRLQAVMLNHDIENKQGEIELLTKDKELQELDLRRQKTIRNAAAITGILLLLLAGGLFNRYKYVRKTKKIIEDEKDLSDKLLLNILPEETAQELKVTGTSMPKQYEMVSVLFTDFKGFTKIAEKLTPFELVEELNQSFLAFDRIIDKYNLEKIKTIGDAYMCAGGIPVANKTNPLDIVRAGLEIREFMENLKKEREAKGEDYWELRIGIHTGPVVAGVVGKNKFAYDIWGDAVNTASRMESSGVPGKVNISGATYELIKDKFECSYRGKIQAKNKGEIDMYIVEREWDEKKNQENDSKIIMEEAKTNI